MKGLDVKFPVLLGDQFNTKAFYMTISSVLGNKEIISILSTIEENFNKMVYGMENKKCDETNME